jgi:hypothetical protein
MNNEPVAFVSKEDLKNMKTHLCYLHLKPQKNDIPLYTHPVKELTDEEIEEVAVINLGHSMGLLNWMGFARAILRKAQKK